MRKANLTRRVANEVEIHWQLDHPSILKLHNYFEDSDYVYLVMELCSNGELYKLLRVSGKLSESQTRGILYQIVSGLSYLHSNGIIHRDLKLSNILLANSNHLKIADFGLAVKLNDPSAEQKTMCGTPNYISPEIVSRLPYGLASDTWALGCMMVTILTGSPPFQSDLVKNTLEKVSRAQYTLPDYLSHEAKDLIFCLLQKDPAKRPRLDSILKHRFFDTKLSVESLPNSILPHKKSVESVGEAISPTKAGPSSAIKLPTFSTIRLKPLKQLTKYGIIQIDSNGQVLMDLAADDHIIRISPDSTTVSLLKRIPGIDMSSSIPSHSYSKSNVPLGVVKKLNYAAKFVELVRSKTPKVIFDNIDYFLFTAGQMYINGKWTNSRLSHVFLQ
jgi:serine/threonine protein kinase